MIIIMVTNNQIQVCDDVIYIVVDSIYNTAGDVDCKSFHPILEYNHHDCNNYELAFNTKDNTACDNNKCARYDVGTL